MGTGAYIFVGPTVDSYFWNRETRGMQCFTVPIAYHTECRRVIYKAPCKFSLAIEPPPPNGIHNATTSLDREWLLYNGSLSSMEPPQAASFISNLFSSSKLVLSPLLEIVRSILFERWVGNNLNATRSLRPDRWNNFHSKNKMHGIFGSTVCVKHCERI
jgi:hypothetical protein